MIKVGSLVEYIPSPSSVFKWEKYKDLSERKAPGLILEKLENGLSHTRRFKVRWHTGLVTEEWITYLKSYEHETG